MPAEVRSPATSFKKDFDLCRRKKIEPLGVASAEVHRMLQEARSQFDKESASSSNDLVRQRPVHIEDADSVARGSPVIQDATGIGQGSSPQRSHDGL